MFFMVDILNSILPIREFCLVRTFLNTWSTVFLYFHWWFFVWSNLKWLKWNFISSWKFHRMWINYFVFFFRIKCFFLWKNLSLLNLWMVFFLIVGDHAFRVRILHKSIWAPVSSSYWHATIWIYKLIFIK